MAFSKDELTQLNTIFEENYEHLLRQLCLRLESKANQSDLLEVMSEVAGIRKELDKEWEFTLLWLERIESRVNEMDEKIEGLLEEVRGITKIVNGNAKEASDAK